MPVHHDNNPARLAVASTRWHSRDRRGVDAAATGDKVKTARWACRFSGKPGDVTWRAAEAASPGMRELNPAIRKYGRFLAPGNRVHFGSPRSTTSWRGTRIFQIRPNVGPAMGYVIWGRLVNPRSSLIMDGLELIGRGLKTAMGVKGLYIGARSNSRVGGNLRSFCYSPATLGAD